jgi:hypothetical protein
MYKTDRENKLANLLSYDISVRSKTMSERILAEVFLFLPRLRNAQMLSGFSGDIVFLRYWQSFFGNMPIPKFKRTICSFPDIRDFVHPF